MTDSLNLERQSSSFSLPILSSSPVFNTREWLNMSSPAEPNYHHQIPSNGIHSSNLFSYTSISATNTAFHSRSLPTAYNNEQTSPFRHLNSPRSDTFPTAFEFTSSSMPSPTLSPVSGANAYQELSSQQEFLSESSRRVKIPVPTITDASFLRYSTTFASSSDSTSLANPTTPKSKSKSKFTHMPVAMPMFPEPELPYSYSDLTPPTTIQPLLLTLLPQNQTQTPQLHQPSFSSVSVPIPRPEDTNTDPDITLDLTDMLLPRSLMKDVDHDHFSFIQSDDWHLSGGVDHEFDSYMHPEYGYISPISRRDRAGTIYDMDAFNTGSGGKQGETVHAALKRSRSDINEKERKETFMQRLISASGRAVGSRSIDFSSPVGERHVKAGGNQESTTMFAHRSLSFPFRDQSQPKYSQYEPQVEPRYDENMSSPLTSLSSSPATSPIPTQSDVKATNTSCTQTPAARRFTRKPHYVYLTPSQLHPSAADLVLTPSCTDQTPGPAPARTRNSSKTENGIGDEGTVNVKHRYRTRSKLAEVKGWTRVNRLRVGKVKETEESVPILRDLRKRKRGMKDASDATPDTMTMAKNKKKRLTDEDETENEEESVYVPSPIAFRRSTRIPMPVSSSSSPACLDTKSKAKSNHELNSLTLQFTSSISTLRTFPPNTPYHPTFPLFYRRFPVPSRTQTISAPLSSQPQETGLDLYTPHATRGSGTTKTGLCPICMESVDNGGEGKSVWLSLKFSAYKVFIFWCEEELIQFTSERSYHMQYYHGISSCTHLPFSPPTSFRLSQRPNSSQTKHEKTVMMEGRCHKCVKWVDIEGVKVGDAKVKEIYWWKHAAKCHQGSNIPGEGDFLLVNEEA